MVEHPNITGKAIIFDRLGGVIRANWTSNLVTDVTYVLKYILDKVFFSMTKTTVAACSHDVMTLQF